MFKCVNNQQFLDCFFCLTLLFINSSALCRPLLSGSAGGPPWSSAAGLLPAGDLLSAPPGGHRGGQHRGQRESPRHLQQAASAAAAGGVRPERAAGKTGESGSYRLHAEPTTVFTEQREIRSAERLITLIQSLSSV